MGPRTESQKLGETLEQSLDVGSGAPLRLKEEVRHLRVTVESYVALEPSEAQVVSLWGALYEMLHKAHPWDQGEIAWAMRVRQRADQVQARIRLQRCKPKSVPLSVTGEISMVKDCLFAGSREEVVRHNYYDRMLVRALDLTSTRKPERERDRERDRSTLSRPTRPVSKARYPFNNPDACYNCGEKGHRALSCTKADARSSGNGQHRR